jgi:hypothetical protein
VPVDTTVIKERVDLLELIDRDTPLRRVASTRGGEYAGPCPFCAGRDRFRVQPKHRRWWCRGCLAGERWQDAIAYVQRRDGHADFVDACRRLGASPSELDRGQRDARSVRAAQTAAALGLRRASQLPRAEQLEPASAWRARARDLVEECEATLWSPIGVRARAYLHGRGLRDETLRRWRVGFQPIESRHEPADRWGLPARTEDGRQAVVWLPRGVMLPWIARGQVWHLKVRTAAIDGSQRYRAVRGGHPRLYGSDTVTPSRPVVFVEAELCAQLIWQEAGDLVDVVSLGGCQRALSAGELAKLAACSPQLLAHDADLDGDTGAACLTLQLPHPRRLRPPAGKDPTAFFQQGGSVREWLWSELTRP